MQSNVLKGHPGQGNVFLTPLGLVVDLPGDSSPRGTARSQAGNAILAPFSRQLIKKAGAGPMVSDDIMGSPGSGSG